MIAIKRRRFDADEHLVTATSGYDPKIIERFADQLLRKADTVRVGFAVGGGVFGVFVGAVPLTPLKSVWGVPPGFGVATVIVGALLGVLVGYVIGEGRAFRYRVQAQSAIFQLEIERRVSSAVAEAVAGAVTPVSAAERAPAQPAPPAPLSPVVPPAPLSPLAPPPTVPSAAETPPMPPLSPVMPSSAPEPVPAEEPAPLPPLSPIAPAEPAPQPSVPPLLRPPGTPAPAAPPTPEEQPPLSPAANG